MLTTSLARAAAILRAGGCVVYPTETYFALGALADNAAALERIVDIKGRPSHKPLPLLVGELAQLDAVVPPGFAAGELGADFGELAALFWPGPLSLVVPCRETLPGLVKDAAGRASVRFTPTKRRRRCVGWPAARWWPPAPTSAAGRRPRRLRNWTRR